MTTTHHPNGVTDAVLNSALHRLGMLDPARMHSWFDDFNKYTAGDWVVTEVGVATQAMADEDGGVLLITNAGADDNSSFQQTVGELFRFEVGKRLFFKARFKVSDATQSDFIMGLQIRDTLPLDVTHGVFFQKDDGDALLDFHIEKNDTATTVLGIHTVVSDTYLTVGYHYDGDAAVEYFVDDVRIGAAAVTNLPDDEDLTVSFGVQNGEAVAKTMSVDHIFVAKER